MNLATASSRIRSIAIIPLILFVASAFATPPQVSISNPADGSVHAAIDPIAFTASAFDFEDGDITDSIVWYTDGQPTLGGGGSISVMLPPGEHAVFAGVTDRNGATRTDIVIVFVFGDAPPDVIIDSPMDGAEFQVGTPVHFSAGASDFEDGDLTDSLVWVSTLDGVIGNGGSFDALLSPGEHIIHAFSTDRGGNTSADQVIVLIVGDVTPDVIITAPRDGSDYPIGSAIQFDATALDYEDGDISDSLIWVSTIDGVIGSGVSFSAVLSPGEHIIHASVTDRGGLTGSDQTIVFVVADTTPDVQIVAPAETAVYVIGVPIEFQATAMDFEEGDLSDQIVWVSDVDGLLGTGPNVTATLSAGEHTIRAAVTDQAGATGADEVLLRVVASRTPDIAIASPLDGSEFEIGTEITFTATAFDYEDGDLTDTIVWRSSIDGILGNGGSITAVLSPGEHTVFAEATDHDGLIGRDEMLILFVEDSTPDVIITSPSDGQLPSRTPITFSATAFDFEDGDLSDQVKWTSDVDGILGVGASITATLSRGVHTIRASVIDHVGVTGSDLVILTIVSDCPADVNEDGVVDLIDLSTILAHFGTDGPVRAVDGDVDLDGQVLLSDLAILLINFGTNCPR